MGFSVWNAAKEYKFRKPRRAFEAVNQRKKFSEVSYQSPKLEAVPLQKKQDFRIVTKAIVFTLLLLACSFMVCDDVLQFLFKKENTSKALMANYYKDRNHTAYGVLMKNGQHLFEDRKYMDAIAEFDRAGVVYSDRLAPKYYRTLSYCNLCLEQNTLCEKAKNELNAFLLLIKEEAEWRDAKIHLMELKDSIN